eukprot:COSAG03_NODE_18588_length_352_cov_0.739130_1_plen_39_part_10
MRAAASALVIVHAQRRTDGINIALDLLCICSTWDLSPGA